MYILTIQYQRRFSLGVIHIDGRTNKSSNKYKKIPRLLKHSTYLLAQTFGILRPDWTLASQFVNLPLIVKLHLHHNCVLRWRSWRILLRCVAPLRATFRYEGLLFVGREIGEFQDLDDVASPVGLVLVLDPYQRAHGMHGGATTLVIHTYV